MLEDKQPAAEVGRVSSDAIQLDLKRGPKFRALTNGDNRAVVWSS
jgi:hypothetical protein